ncbi:MAG: AbrB/MazE/SpoVT family DNA-binding domain-containing protein [Vicinamibacteria bacterium]
MERQLVQAGGSLAVTLPAEIVKEFKLKKGMSVEVSIHPQTRAVTIRPGVKLFEDGKVTTRFEKLTETIMDKYEDAFAELAK